MIDRFVWFMDQLCMAIAARSHVLPAPLVRLIWRRVRRTRIRFVALAARIRAGVPARRRSPRGAAPRSPAPLATPAPDDTRLHLPRGFAWLCLLVPQHAASAGNSLAALLSDPEMAALIAADPRVGRILRPLFRMLGIRPAPSLQPAAPNQPHEQRLAVRGAAARKTAPLKTAASLDATESPEATEPQKSTEPPSERGLRKYLPWVRPRPMPAARVRPTRRSHTRYAENRSGCT